MSQYLYLGIVIIQIVAHRGHVVRHGCVDLVDEALHHVCVLRVKVKCLSEMLQGPIYHSLAPVYLSDHHMNGSLFRNLILQLKQYLQGVLMAVQGDKYVSFLEFVERVLFVYLFGLFEPGQGFLGLAAIVANHSHVCV